jgi:hypothetical protein
MQERWDKILNGGFSHSLALCSARPDTLARPAPHLNLQSWNPRKFADIDSDHRESVGNTGGRQP